METSLFNATSVFTEVSDCFREAMLRIAKRLTLPKGTILVVNEAINQEIYFVEAGLTRSFYDDGQREVTLWLTNEGRFLWPLLINSPRATPGEHIQLLEPTTLVVLRRDDLEQEKQLDQAFCLLKHHLMEQALKLFEQRIRFLLLPKAEQRLEAYIQAYPELYRRVPLRFVATYLGIDPATLSRLRGNYRQKTRA